METVIILVFVFGYLAITLEHNLKIDKLIPALVMMAISWALISLGIDSFPNWFDSANHGLVEGFSGIDHDGKMHLLEETLLHHLGKTAEILVFLLGAMTIVEIIDKHSGFKIITDRIKTTKKVKLLWILSVLTFFMSAALDNLTTTIVMVALLRKLISDKQTKWFFASMIVLAANAGGAWSPIGDVTTIMLWIGSQVSAGSIIANVIVPSIFTMVVPLIIVSFTMKGNITKPVAKVDDDEELQQWESTFMLILGVAGLLFVPVFKTVFHLPPYQGMLLSLSVIWLATEILRRRHSVNLRDKLNVIRILKSVELPTIFFFLGILSAVAALQSAGQLNIMANFLDDKLGNIFLIDMAIGVLSAVVDNVPLVAGSMGMYPIEDAASIAALTDPAAIEYAQYFTQDGLFWEFLAYCAGTGGSILIIGSAAGVAAMGMEHIDFIWYLKKISWLALIGYIAGAGVYYLQAILLGHVAH